MTHEVFISYSSKDKPIADAVCANLELTGIRCWIAPRDIAPGEDWPTAITKAIAQSRIMVLIFSASSNSSEDVSRELFLAANSKLVIIPFKIENIEPEPGKQYYLARTHWLDAINPPTKEQITALVNRVRSILPATDPGSSEKTEPVQENQPRKDPAAKKRKSLWRPVWISVALIVLGTFIWILFFGGLNKLSTLLTPSVHIVPTLPPSNIIYPRTSTPSISFDFSTDFNDQAFNGTYDPQDWILSPDIMLTSIHQTDGVMVFSKLSPSGSENGNLKTIQQWSLGEFSYIEAQLMLDPESSGENGNVALTLWDSGSLWAGCGIQIGNPSPYLWCGQGSESGNDYMSDSYFLEYGQWYTIRIVFDSQTNEFKCYLDDALLYNWQPPNLDNLLSKKYIVTIGTWAEDGTSITGFVDNMRVVK